MARQLGGSWGISLLAQSGLVKLLCRLAGGKTISEIELRKELNIIAQGQKGSEAVDSLLKALIDVKALALGLEIQCPTCSMRSWFSVKDVDYGVSCPNCFSTFRIPSHSPNEMKWSYRALGPFNLPKASFGAYCVLLTLNFFSRSLSGATTPMLSFEMTKDDKKLEADLGMFYTRSKFTEESPLLILAECKTHMPFKAKDISRMAMLSRAFPGALIVYATLNTELSQGERSRIRAQVYRARKRRLKSKTYCDVLVLTAHELTSMFGPTDKWESLTPKHKALRDYAERDLEHLADATQQLNLDMEPWHEWFQKNRPAPRPASPRTVPKLESRQNMEAIHQPKIYLRVSTRIREVKAIDPFDVDG